MKRSCPSCGQVHPSNAAIAVNRFKPAKTMWSANYPGAPMRLSRARAEQDWCEWEVTR